MWTALLSNRDGLPLLLCLNLASCLFVMGLVGIVWNKRNLLVMILCTEIMFLSIALNFIFFAIYTHNDLGQVYALLIITTAAAETAIGLSLLTLSYRLSNKISYGVLITLRG